MYHQMVEMTIQLDYPFLAGVVGPGPMGKPTTPLAKRSPSRSKSVMGTPAGAVGPFLKGRPPI